MEVWRRLNRTKKERHFLQNSDDHDVGQEDRGTSFGEVESGNQTNGINETPSPTFSEKGEQEGVDLDARSDDNAPGERDLSEPYPKSHGAMVEWGEFESEDELSSIKETSSTSVSGRDQEAGANPESKSDDHSDRHAARLGPLGAGNSFAHAVSGDELNNISDTPGELLSGQGKAEVTPFSNRPATALKNTLRVGRTRIAQASSYQHTFLGDAHSGRRYGPWYRRKAEPAVD